MAFFFVVYPLTASVPLTLPLPNANWRVWRWIGLRGAGFPARHVLALAAPASASAARELAQNQLVLQRHQKELLDVLHAELRQTPHGSPENARLWEAIVVARKNRLPPIEQLSPAAQASARAIEVAQASQTAATERYRQAFNADQPHLRQAISSIANDPRFQEAVLWQNRRAMHESVTWLARHPHKSDSQARQKERLVANYLQRYCVKNDTIGFFGPIGWGQFRPEGLPLTLTHGTELLTKRVTYFEHWGIAELARQMAHDPTLKLWLAPRLSPHVYVADHTLHFAALNALALDGKLPANLPTARVLSEDEWRVLQHCDGQTPACHIAEVLSKSASEVYTLLEHLTTQGAVLWGLDLPLTLNPLRHLLAWVEHIGEPDLRGAWLEKLQALENAREAVQGAAGKVEQLDQALGDLEDTFTHLTQTAATREHGKTYAARTLVYEDCERDLQATFGPTVLARLGPPLALVLQSARWFTYELAGQYRHALREIYTTLAAKTQSALLSFHHFFTHAAPLLTDPQCAPLQVARQKLLANWQTVLGAPPEDAPWRLAVADLAPRVREVFAAPHAGWELARYCSPDVLIAAPEAAAINAGQFQLILGELHLFNTLARLDFVAHHPAPAELYAARAQDLPSPVVFPVPSSNWNIQRNALSLILPTDILLDYEATPSPHPANLTLRASEIVIVDSPAGLRAQTRDGRHDFDLIEFLGYRLSNQCLTYPGFLPPASHSPRLMFDDLVITRASWRYAPSAIPFTALNDPPERFLSATHWAMTQALPRFMFARFTGEIKPQFVDWESPLYVEQCARAIAKSKGTTPNEMITFTEMLPTIEQTWLTDYAQNAYTSELRLVLVDSMKLR